MVCGGWLYHAFQATNLLTAFHVGGAEPALDGSGDFFDRVEAFGNGLNMQVVVFSPFLVRLKGVVSLRISFKTRD